MEPTKISSAKNTKTADITTSEASKPVEVSSKPTDTKTAETASPKSATSAKKEESRRILSVSLPEKLARQLRLLCATTGTTTQAVVETALRKAINKQLGAAIESLKSDLEG